MHYQLQLDFLTSFDRDVCESHADPSHCVGPGGYVEQYVPVNVGNLFSDNAAHLRAYRVSPFGSAGRRQVPLAGGQDTTCTKICPFG